jgi:hypothetical protein
VALTSANQDFIIKNGAIILGTNPVTSSTNQSGSFQTYGGAAVAQNLIVGTTATVYGNFESVGPAQFDDAVNVAGLTTLQDLTVNGALNAAGGIQFTGNLNFSGTSTFNQNVLINSTLSSLTTVTNNALYVAGGVGIQNGLLVSGPALFKSEVTFSGSATYVYSTNTVYTDNIIELHTPPGGVNSPWTYDDGKDIGFRFHYFNGTDTNAALVLADDTKYLEWYSAGVETVGNFTSATYGTFKLGSVKLVGGTPSLLSTSSGDLTITGGVGIGQDLVVGTTATVLGNLTVNGTIIGTVTTATSAKLATTATNLAGGAAGSLPYQSSPGNTLFLPIGSNGTLLTVFNNTLTWASASNSTVGFALTATNLLAGLTGAVPFQSSPGVTAFDSANFYYTNSGTTTATLNVENLSIFGTAYGTYAGAGALQVAGGAYFGKQVYINGTGTGALSVLGAANFADTVTLNGAINGTSSGLGTLVLPNGGMFVREDVYSSGTVTAQNLQDRSLGNNSLVYSDLSGFLQNALYFNTITNTIVGSITQANNLNGGATGAIPFQSTSSATTFDSANLYYSSNTLFTPNLNVTSSATIQGNLYVDGTIYIQGVGVDTITSTTGSFRDVVSTGTIYATYLTATNQTYLNGGVIGTTATFTNLVVGSTLTTVDLQSNTIEVSGLTSLGNVTATNVTVTNLTVTGISSIGGVSLNSALAANLTVTNILNVGSLVNAFNGIFTGTITVYNLTSTGTITANSFVSNGSASVQNTLSVNNTATLGSIISTSTQEAIATNIASIVSNGGIAAAKSIYAGGPITVGTTLSGPGNVVPALYSNNTLLASYTSNTISGNSIVNLDTYSATAYRTARYTVQVVDQVNVSTTSCHVTEMTVFHDGVNVYINEYGTSTNNGELGGFSANLVSGQVILNFTPTNATSMTIKVVRFGITA